jgi:hypothetical protein
MLQCRPFSLLHTALVPLLLLFQFVCPVLAVTFTEAIMICRGSCVCEFTKDIHGINSSRNKV